MSTSPVFRPAAELVRLLRQRELSSVELTRAYLERIERLNPRLDAFVLVLAEQALAAAADADRRLALEGEELPPLLGLPISLKDLNDTAGVRTTYGSRAFADFVPQQDSEVTARLKRAGTVLLGKTNTPEFGLRPTTEFGLFPPARNPWNPERTTGGSSGGGAAAVATALCALAEGGDGGGSLRIPGSCCGVVGLKPARGRVPCGPLSGEHWAGLATNGPLAWTVEDAALMLDVLAGPAPGDPYRATPPAESFQAASQRDPEPLRIAWATRTSEAECEPEVAAATQQALATLADLGHQVEEVALNVDGMWEALWQIAAAQTSALPIQDVSLLEPHARRTYEAGRALPAGQYVNAVHQMHRLSRQLVGHLAPYDLLVTPTMPRTAPPLGTIGADAETAPEEIRRYIPFTYPFNLTGQPAISLPLAQGSDGLPIGVQLVGRPADEVTVLSVAGQLERCLSWHDRRPPTD